MAKLISETDYFNGCDSFATVEEFQTRHEARNAMARVLRQVRTDYSVIALKDGPELYLITNALGPRIFERSLRVQS